MRTVAENRVAIKAVLDSFDGITGMLYQSTNPEVGTGFPRLAAFNRGPAQNFERQWYVVVLLHSDAGDADELFEALAEPLSDALEEAECGFVDEINQIVFPVGTNTELYGLQVIMRSE